MSAPIETKTVTPSHEEMIVFRIAPRNYHPVFDHSEWEHTGTWDFLYNEHPNSDDSEVDGHEDSEDLLVMTSRTTNRSGLKKFNTKDLLPKNWWGNLSKSLEQKAALNSITNQGGENSKH